MTPQISPESLLKYCLVKVKEDYWSLNLICLVIRRVADYAISKANHMNFLDHQRKPLLLTLLAVIFLALLPSSNAQEPTDKMQTGIVVLTAFEGDVKISISSNGQTQPPSKGAILKQGHVIVTGPNSKASLAFENGVVMEVAPSSKFAIQEFQQSPWDVSPDKLAEMKTEPSKSKTTGFLEYGKIITGVKKLKSGSHLDIGTPIGSAGIRGTDFETSSTKNSDGSPKSFTVGVATGEVGVRSAGGSEAVPVVAGLSSTVTVSPSNNGQRGTISQPTTSTLSAEAGSGILTSVNSQRTSGQAVFGQALAAAAQNRQNASSTLTPKQQKTLEEASSKGDQAVVEAVQVLCTEAPTAAAEIAAAAAELAPNAAPQIAAVAALVSPSLAPQIAASVALLVPSSATSIASSVAQAVPTAAAAVAGAVASVTPTLAPQIAVAVATVVPESAAQIAQSVAAAQPQQIAQITSQIVENVAGVDSQSVGDAAQAGAQQTNNSGNNLQPQPPRVPDIAPIPVPKPTPTPTSTPQEIRSPR